MRSSLREAESPHPAARNVGRTGAYARVVRRLRKAARDSSAARALLFFGALIVFTVFCGLILRQRHDFAAPIAHAAQPHVARLAAFQSIDDDIASSDGARFAYTGDWQHVRNVRDGRSEGTSSRTYHAGAMASFAFTGERLKVFGVKGPNGGYADLRIDGRSMASIRFFAPGKEAGALVYVSPRLAAGKHTAQIVVARAPALTPRRRFVNLDGAQFAVR